MDPETPPTADPAAAAQPPADQPAGTETAAAPTLELPFTLEDVNDDFALTGEEARRWLQTRQAQMQAGLTKKFGELATERDSVTSLAELQRRLESDDTRQAALNELLEPYGFALPEDEPPPPNEPPADVDPLTESVADLQARIEAQEQAAQARETATANAEAERVFNEHVVTSLDSFAREQGFKGDQGEEGLDALPEHIYEEVVARAVASPRRSDGLLDFDAAIAAHLAAEEVKRQAYLASKTAPVVAPSGSSGVPVTDVASRADRLKAANAVAARALSR